jgi:Cysteine-rich CWC
MSKVLKTLKTIVVGGRDLKCAACGNDFVCGVSLKGCWCSEIELNDEIRAKLKTQYSDCLCRDCLEKQKREIS